MTLIKAVWEKGLFHILSGSFLTKIVGFFGSIFIVRVLSKQEYGILGYLENVFIIAGMGLSNAILRFVILGKDINEKYSYFQYTVRKGFLWNILLAVIAGTVFLLYPHPEAYQGYTWLILVLLLALPFQYLTDNTLCNERAMFANQRYAVLAFILSASIIVSKIISGYLGGLYAVVICQALVYVVLGIAFLYNTGRKYYINASANTLQRIEKKKINSYSLQYMITNGLWAIFMLNDTFLLGRFCTPEVIADYRVAYTIPGSISIISSAIGIYVAPYFVQHENDRSWIQKNFKRAYGITAFVVGGLCIAIAVLSKPIIWRNLSECYWCHENSFASGIFQLWPSFYYCQYSCSNGESEIQYGSFHYWYGRTVADQFSNYPDLWSYWCGANQLYCLWNYGSMFTGSVCETVLLKGIEV